MKFRLIPPRFPEKMGLDTQTDGKQSDPLRVPFYPLRYGTLKNGLKRGISTFRNLFLLHVPY